MVKIFLAGKVPKGKEQNKDFSESIISNINLDGIDFIKGENRNLDESDFFLVFGWDCRHIKNADIVIVDAREKIGVGTSQEMLIAKYFGKPVITLLPKNTHHRRTNLEFNGKIISDWIHPFIYSASDIIIENENELNASINKIMGGKTKIKDLSIIDESIKYADETG